MTQLWPPVDDPRTLTRQVWDARTARTIPGMGRVLSLYGGLISQMSLQAFRGIQQQQPAPRLLERPDPDMARPTFVSAHIEDYLLHGNACHLVTARDAEGWPAATRWYPASAWSIKPDRDNQPEYRLHGKPVRRTDVVHVQRGADPAFPFRGVGIVEQHLSTLDRAGLESAATSASLRERGMPAVAVITPNAELDPDNADKVADKWVERFTGPTPKPGIFPKDTQVIPLSWNPTDQQLVQARGLTLKDIANCANLDGYWLGAEGSSHTYRSPGPMYLTLLRTSLGPVLSVFEDVWSFMWLPRGRQVRFDRVELLRDDLPTMVKTFDIGLRAGLFADANEPRQYMGFPPLPEDQLRPPAGPPPPDDDTDPEDETEKPEAS